MHVTTLHFLCYRKTTRRCISWHQPFL